LPAPALVLFDIDGTLIRRAGPHHREALVKAIRRVTGLDTTTEHIDTSGKLDPDIMREMMRHAGARSAFVDRCMDRIIEEAQSIYARSCPDLQRSVCPGVRNVLRSLQRRDVPVGLVTGNLTRIAWKKMRQAGIYHYFRFGAFAEMAETRAGLVDIAVQHAHDQRWVHRHSRISLIGDHPNDIEAAKINGIRSIAVATGVCARADLCASRPDVLLPDLRALRLEMLL
jgi:phosphoglycolate phosphatase-like HAD superfamily hydrolase